MSDVAQGPGWWQASDGRWYPPETLAQALGQTAPAPVAGPEPVQVTPQAGAYPGYGAPAGAPEYGWAAPVTQTGWQRNRMIGTLLMVLGLAGIVWGVGELYVALAFNNSPVYPNDELIGSWLVTGGILLASVTTVVIGLVVRRP